jgi:hypothetical protein
VTLDGTVAAAVLLLVRLMLRAGLLPAAGAFRVTVAMELATPPRTLIGFRVTETIVGGSRVRAAVLEPLNVPVIVAVIAFATDTLFTVKLALVAPAGTVTFTGTVALGSLLESVTSAPPASAGLSNVTVPVVEVLPVISVGLSVTLERAGALTVNAAVLVTPL